MQTKPVSNPDDFIAELDALLDVPPVVLVPPPPLPQMVAPPQTEEAAARTEPTPAAPPLPAPRILVVDDNDDYRETVRFFLTEHGYKVIEASDGVKGAAAAREHKPDLILLDFNMPHLNGYELVQELRSDPDMRDVRLIMFTGSSNRRNLRGLLPDLCDFLDKPVSNARLLQSVKRAIGSARQEGSAEDAAAPEPATAEERVDDDLSLVDDLLVNAPEEKRDEEGGLEVLANDSPLVARVNKILIRAVDMGASDIHIEPQERELVVRVRVNGALQRLAGMPVALAGRLVARVKIMANLVITERRLPQDGQIRAVIRGQKIEFRVSTLPSLFGEKIVLRVLGGGKIKGSLSELGLSSRDLEGVEQALKTPHGLILVTGPTGSGKSTTLYSMIRAVNNPDVNVMTAEDPVEYEMPGITQVPVRPKIGLTFESVLRSFLRQDPDVMLVGEIRDLETAEISVKAAITGHLVFSTLHTNSAPATLMRMAHMGLAPYLLASAVKLVIAQRLVRCLCRSCRLPVALADTDRRFLAEKEAETLKSVFRAVGCRECAQTGYKGRMPLFEVMPVRTAQMRQCILSGASVDALADLAAAEGMKTLREAAVRAAADGETSMAEAFKVMAD